MTSSRITSRENPLIKTVRLVAKQSRKSPPDLVLAEGVRVLEEVLASGHEIEFVIISDGYGSSEREARLLDAFSHRPVRVLRSPPLFAQRNIRRLESSRRHRFGQGPRTFHL